MYRNIKKANERIDTLEVEVRTQKSAKERAENRESAHLQQLEHIAELLIGPNWQSEIQIENVSDYITGLLREVDYSKKLYHERNGQMQYMSGERDRLYALIREILGGPPQEITGPSDIPMQGLTE